MPRGLLVSKPTIKTMDPGFKSQPPGMLSLETRSRPRDRSRSHFHGLGLGLVGPGLGLGLVGSGLGLGLMGPGLGLARSGLASRPRPLPNSALARNVGRLGIGLQHQSSSRDML